MMVDGFKKKLLNESPYILLAILLFYFLCTHSPFVENDVDPSYLLFGPIRPPLYPMFIWLFRWAGSYQFSLIIWVQGILLFTSLLYARYWLKKNLQLSGFPVFFVCFVVIVTIGLHFQIWFIQSEGLSFPFFIWTFFLLVDCMHKFSLKKLSFLALWVSILVLTRVQFYYLYIIFGILCCWYLWQKVPIKLVSKGAAILFGSMILTIVIDHSYHYFKHGFFGGSPYKGILVLMQTLYLADDHAADYFQNPVEKTYMQELINQRNAQHLNQDAELTAVFKPSYYNYANQSYQRNSLLIQKVIEDTLDTSIENKSGKTTNFNSDRIAMDINKTLISHAPKQYILFILWRFVDCMGGVPYFLFFSILLFSAFFKIVKNKIQTQDYSVSFLMIITLITFFNAAIVAVSNNNLPVYFCYNQFMLYCLAAFFVNKVI